MMDEICRLCCSPSFVKNYIFDESTALHLKMSLYMPIKVFKNDRLPQRICDRCSCRVNDMYQFCNEAIEVQNRLRAALIASGVVGSEVNPTTEVPTVQVKLPPSPVPVQRCEQFTQTEPPSPPPPILTDPPYNLLVKVKEEPDLKPENYEDLGAPDHFLANAHSDESDNVTLNSLKKKKKRKYKKVKTEMTNGDTKKKKKKQKKWDLNDLMGNMPEGLTVGLVGKAEALVKQETDDGLLMKVKVKTEEETYNCCICFMKCFSRIQMLQHYKEHAEDMMMPASPPPPPPLPETPPPLRCPRCSKVLEPAGWDEHWRRHWERDRRPFRCARCERAFRHPHQILAHGQTHDNNQETAEDLQEKRFICDLCPEGFVYMRYLLSHRARAHPEAGCAAPTLRCAECSREFAHLNSLRRHLRAHSGRRDHLCSVCGKALSSREHLKFHLRIHAGYKPNVCKTCGKGFVKKCNLTLHERTHSGEKPYVCAHCSKAFSQRSTLVIHERYHSGARPYVCSLCGRGFVAKGLLSMHLKTTCI